MQERLLIGKNGRGRERVKFKNISWFFLRHRVKVKKKYGETTKQIMSIKLQHSDRKIKWDFLTLFRMSV
jgi:hypothetical protein